MNNTLRGTVTLVTRPVHQAENLCHLISEHGGEFLLFPTLAIKPLPLDDQIMRKLARLHEYRWLIFVSANAVNFTLKANNGKINALGDCKIAAVGKATAMALHQWGCVVDLVPSHGFNSEALLEEEPLQQVAGQKIMIARGIGGREKLADCLKSRGAEVDYLQIYRRERPDNDIAELLTLLKQQRLSVVVVNSVESLQNLLVMLGQWASLILSIPLLVISRRIARLAEQKGFKQIIVSAGPGDIEIVQALIRNNGE